MRVSSPGSFGDEAPPSPIQASAEEGVAPGAPGPWPLVR